MLFDYDVPKHIERNLKEVDENGVAKKQKLETKLTGKIVIDVPGYEDATKAAEEVSMKVDKNGEMVDAGIQEQAKRIIEITKRFVKSVEVVSANKKFTFDDLDKLGCVKEGRAVINDVFSTIIHGFQLGNE